jgi:4-amino-4-deoxy-L-arabinose transferase-like glycosyltransferase
LPSLRRYAPVFTLVLALASLYLYDLSAVGVLDPDEPRYLAIGRAMAATGDYVTPRLWGSPWFEKPPLLYWLTALGTKAQLGIELSGRLPVALLSLSFLAAMFFLVKAAYGREIAGIAVVLLGSSAGWLAYSSLALTDLPLTVFYSLAILIALPLVGSRSTHQHQSLRLLLIGIALGIATLAKGLVPLVLAIPFAWFLRTCWRKWWLIAVGLFATALPWYVAMAARNGLPFFEEFFWKHHFERVYSPALQHVQPWWYYVPVLLGALLPWTPLVGFVFARRREHDARRRFLAVCVGFGVLVFSIVLNKLPGYLLPMIPSVFLLVAISIDWRARALRLWLTPCAILIGFLPLLAQILPGLLAAGRITLPQWPHLRARDAFYIALPLAVVILARRSWLLPLLVLSCVAGALYLKITVYPVLDRTASARGTWTQIKDERGSVCDNWIPRKWAYGLALYRQEPYPLCGTPGVRYDYKLESHGTELPVLVPNGSP